MDVIDEGIYCINRIDILLPKDDTRSRSVSVGKAISESSLRLASCDTVTVGFRCTDYLGVRTPDNVRTPDSVRSIPNDGRFSAHVNGNFGDRSPDSRA